LQNPFAYSRPRPQRIYPNCLPTRCL